MWITLFINPVYKELILEDGTDLNKINPENEIRDEIEYRMYDLIDEEIRFKELLKHEPYI